MDVLNDEEFFLESLYDYVLVDHEKHALCDGYIVEFVRREGNMVIEIFMIGKHPSR